DLGKAVEAPVVLVVAAALIGGDDAEADERVAVEGEAHPVVRRREPLGLGGAADGEGREGDEARLVRSFVFGRDLGIALDREDPVVRADRLAGKGRLVGAGRLGEGGGGGCENAEGRSGQGGGKSDAAARQCATPE